MYQLRDIKCILLLYFCEFQFEVCNLTEKMLGKLPAVLPGLFWYVSFSWINCFESGSWNKFPEGSAILRHVGFFPFDSCSRIAPFGAFSPPAHQSCSINFESRCVHTETDLECCFWWEHFYQNTQTAKGVLWNVCVKGSEAQRNTVYPLSSLGSPVVVGVSQTGLLWKRTGFNVTVLWYSYWSHVAWST